MSELRTDFKDEILQDGESHRVYNIKRKGTDEVVESGIYLEKAYTPQQEGDEFGAKEVNETHAILNVLSQDNLLINSDFKSGIINQKGETEYITNSAYTIDMWRCISSNNTNKLKVNVFEGYITITNTSENQDGYFKQNIFLESGKYTFSVMVKNLNGNVKLYVTNESGREGETEISNYGFFKNTIDSNVQNLTFLLPPKSSISIEYVKLEKGSHFTGMPVLNIAIELEKCMRKFEIGTITMPVINGYISHFQFKTEKDKFPTISYENVKCGYEGVSGMKNSSDVKQSSVTTRGINFTQDAYSGILWFSCDYIADSYDY